MNRVRRQKLSFLRTVVIFSVPIIGMFLVAGMVPVLLLFSFVAFALEMLQGRSNKVIFALFVLQLWWIATWYIVIDSTPSDMDAAHRIHMLKKATDGTVLKTISVVLPCSGEGIYARKTIESVSSTVPGDILHEVIVVDDNSHPPLTDSVLDDKFCQEHKVTILRQNEQQGLIRAKLIGGNAASGDIIVFFDCHVAPQPQWYLPFLENINENYKRVVIPMITALDINTWRQIGPGGMSKCYITFDADFKWFDSDNDDAPALSGGLLGLSRKWWTETAGYDKNMYGWGGENIDQSLRIWLCGGEMKVAPAAKVAHMWRGNDEKTRAHYPATGSASKNRLRAVYGWMGPFANKAEDFPLGNYGKDVGDLSNIWEVRDRLKCKPFAYYLYRFRNIYIEGGLVPEQVFALKTDGGCLVYQGAGGTSSSGFGQIGLDALCSLTNRHWFHAANRMTSKFKNLRDGNNAGLSLAFSGLRAWNTDQCVQSIASGSWRTAVCIIDGASASQQWRILDGKITNVYSKYCLSVSNNLLVKASCDSASTWVMHEAFAPSEWLNYKKALAEQPEIYQ